MVDMRTLLLLGLLVSPLGCQSERDERPVPSSTGPAVEAQIVVVGDDTAADVARRLQEAGLKVSVDRDEIRSASLVVVAQAATPGLGEVHRTLVREIAKTPNRRMLWIQTKTADVDDQELLELQELEARELLNTFGLPGDTLPFAVDARKEAVNVGTLQLQGWEEIVRFVRGPR